MTSQFDPTAYEGWGDLLSGYMPDMSGYALAENLPAGFDPSGYDWSDVFDAYQRGAPDLSNYLTAGDLPAGFDPSGYDWSDVFSDYQRGAPDLSSYLTSADLPAGFDPSGYDWSDIFSTYQRGAPDLSGYVTGTPWADQGYLTAGDLPSAPDLSGYLTAADLPAGFDPSSYDWSNVFSDYQRGAPDLSGYVTGTPWADQGYLTAADLPSAPDLSGYMTSQFDPTGYDWADIFDAYQRGAPDLSGYMTESPWSAEGIRTAVGDPWADQGYLTSADLEGYMRESPWDAEGIRGAVGTPWADQGYITSQFDPSTYDYSDIFSQYGYQPPGGMDYGALAEQYNQTPAAQQHGLSSSYDPESGRYVIDLAGFGFEGADRYQYKTPEEMAGMMGVSLSDYGEQSPWEQQGYVRASDIGGIVQNILAEMGYDVGDITAGGSMAGGGVVGYQNQGQVAGPQGDPAAIKPVAEAAALAIAGQHPNPDEAIAAFIAMFGQEAFVQFREQILQALAGNQGATTEGLIDGSPQGMQPQPQQQMPMAGMQPQGPMPMAAGGLSDNIPGTVAGQQDIAVSPGEFIVPSDVVSGIGDGDTDSGAKRLYDMMDRVRQNRTGTQKQPAPINVAGVMPR